MPLVKCPDCRKRVSDSASQCPKCGYPLTPEIVLALREKEQRRNKSYAVGCLTLLLIGLLGSLLEEKPPKPPVDPRKEMIMRQFSSWDGSHPGLVEYVKSQMLNPSSFEHVETFYRDEGDHLLVTMKYRGTNLFGAVVTNQIWAKVDFEGNVVEIVGDLP